MTKSPTATPAKENLLPRILIIDDNQRIHRDFDLVFREEGSNPELAVDAMRLYGTAARLKPVQPTFALDHALSGVEGVGKVKQGLAEGRFYQLAFVDIRMPGIDGVETIDRIWQIDPRIQMVICTAYADYSQEDLTQRLGFSDKLLVLKKPFDSIEVTQLAITLTEKWHLATQAALKLEQMELLVAHRTQKVLELQRRGSEGLPEAPSDIQGDIVRNKSPEATFSDNELPLLLLVGHNAEVCRQIEQGLAGEYRFLEAKDGQAGFNVAQETVPDLILVSAGAVKLDGFELCRRLKSDEITSHIPVILLATPGSGQQQITALGAGADDFLAGPLNLQLLRARTSSLLQARQSAHHRFIQEITLNPREIATSQVDVEFLRRLIAIVEQHMADFEFDVEVLSEKMFMSRSKLFRKLKAVSGCAPNIFIRNLRLKRAAQLLKESGMTVTEITYAVGFTDLKHFRAIFREHFGALPGEYAGSAAENGARP